MSSRDGTAFLLAGLQFEPLIGEPEQNRRATEDGIRRAAAAGARLVVLPEACTSGYVFESRDELVELAEAVPSGPSVTLWAALAAELDLYVVAGLVERRGDDVFNSAVLVGPQGWIGTYEKAHLWNAEKDLYAPNVTGFPVFETELGRIGIGICYDAWFPETFRTTALAGADLLALPANWVPVPGQPEADLSMASMLCMTGAHSNHFYVAGISRTGVERGQEFIGRSVIVGPEGWALAGPASGSEPELLLAEVDLIGSRSERWGNPFNQPVLDRRTDLYKSGPADGDALSGD